MAFVDTFGTRQTVCLVLAALYVVYAALSTWLFYHYREDSGIRHRGVQLTVISAVVSVPLMVVMLIWTPMDSNLNGWVVLWVISLLIPTWVLLSFSRFLRLVFFYRVSEAKLLAAERGHAPGSNSRSDHNLNGHLSPTGNVSSTNLVGKEMQEHRPQQTTHSSLLMDPEEDATPEELLQRNWFHRNRKRVTARLYVQTVAVFMLLHVVATGIVSIVYATTRPGALDGRIRERHFSFIPLELFCLVWYGILVFFLREQTKLRDAHGIHLECKVWLPISSTLYSAFLITSWAFPDSADMSHSPSPFPPIAFIVVHFFCGHTIFVFWPALRVARARSQRRAIIRRQPSRNDQDRKAFNQLLLDPRRFNKFKTFCVTDFSVENALFLERYRRFKDLVEAGDQIGTTFSVSSGAGKVIEKSVAFILGGNNSTSPNGQQSPNEQQSFPENVHQGGNGMQRLSDDALKELKAIYATFMATDAEFEVNVTSNCRHAVANRIRDGDATGDVLDDSYREIYQLIYQSTYPRYIAYKNRRNSGSSRNDTARVSQMVAA